MFISALLVASGVWAQSFWINGDFEYTITGNDEVEFSQGGYYCSGNYTVPTTVTDPEMGKKYKVTSIGSSAFSGSSVKTVTLPNNITSIGARAFKDCQFLTSINIGALWFGIGKTKEKRNNGLEYVIMIAIKRMPENSFRKDMFKAKRKTIDEIWSGEQLDIANIVRFTPSACNTQPWFIENNEDTLSIYRYKKPGKRGIMPVDKVMFYNRIDIGIFLFILETCLNIEGVAFQRDLFADVSGSEVEKTLSAKYRYNL